MALRNFFFFFFFFCLRSTHHASCSSWCRSVPISLTGVTSRLCRDRTGRYLRDNSVRRGAYPGLGPPGPCSFLSHVDIPPLIVQLFVFLNSKHRSANQSRAHPTVTNLTWRDSILPLDASKSNLRTIELFRVTYGNQPFFICPPHPHHSSSSKWKASRSWRNLPCELCSEACFDADKRYMSGVSPII